MVTAQRLNILVSTLSRDWKQAACAALLAVARVTEGDAALPSLVMLTGNQNLSYTLLECGFIAQHASCAPGRTGVLCASCEHGWYLHLGQCAACPSHVMGHAANTSEPLNITFSSPDDDGSSARGLATHRRRITHAAMEAVLHELEEVHRLLSDHTNPFSFHHFILAPRI